MVENKYLVNNKYSMDILLVSLFLFYVASFEPVTNMYIPNPHEAYRPSQEPRIQQLSHYASTAVTSWTGASTPALARPQRHYI